MTFEELKLTDDERNKISVTAKDQKFLNKEVDTIYEKDILVKLNIFTDSYRFLINLSNTHKIESNIKSKIKTFVEQFKDIHTEIWKYKLELDENISYREDQIISSMNDLIIQNEEKINKLIDEAFSLGRVIKVYDPDSYQGIR